MAARADSIVGTVAAVGGPLAQARAALPLTVLLAFAVIYLVWGSTYLAIRVALESLPPYLMIGVRSAIAGGVLYAWGRLRGVPAPTAAQWRAAALCGALMFTIGQGSLAWAQQRVDSGIASLLAASGSLWMPLLGWKFAGDARPGLRVAIGLLGGFVGLGLLLKPGGFGDGGIHLLSAVVILGSALAWACGALYSRSARLPDSVQLSAGMQLLAGGGGLLLVAIVNGEAGAMAGAEVSLRSAAALAYLIVFGSVLAFSAYVWLLRIVSPTKVATHAFVNPVVAVLLGWALAAEPLTAMTLVAAALIVASVALVVTGR